MIVRLPLREPFALGAKVKVYLQLLFAARLEPQVLAAVIAKSPAFVPPIAPLNEIAPACLLVTVTVFAVLVLPTLTEPKATFVSDTVTGTNPVPARVML